MSEYKIRVKSEDGKTHHITTEERKRAIRYGLWFLARPFEYKEVSITVGTRTWAGEKIREIP